MNRGRVTDGFMIWTGTSIVPRVQNKREFLTPSTVDAMNVNSREIVHASFVNFVDLEKSLRTASTFSNKQLYPSQFRKQIARLFGRNFDLFEVCFARELILDDFVFPPHRSTLSSGHCTPLS